MTQHMRNHILSLPISSVDCFAVAVQLCVTFVDARCYRFAFRLDLTIGARSRIVQF